MVEFDSHDNSPQLLSWVSVFSEMAGDCSSFIFLGMKGYMNEFHAKSR